MASFTSFLNLYKPGGGSSGIITPDEVADVDRFNANSDLIDAWAQAWGLAAERNHQFYGSESAKASVTGMKLGDTYQETDGDKKVWAYNGTAWLLWNAPVKVITSFGSGWSAATNAEVPRVLVRSGIAYTFGGVLLTSGSPSYDPVCTIPDLSYARQDTAPGATPIAGVAQGGNTSQLITFGIKGDGTGILNVAKTNGGHSPTVGFSIAGHWVINAS